MTGCSEILSTRFLLPLFQFPSLSSPCCDGAKTLGAVLCAEGRERPHGSLSSPKGRKVGSLPPNSVFWPRRFSLPSPSHLFGVPWLRPFPGDIQTERPPERHLLSPVHPDSSSLARKSCCFGTRQFSKYTFRFGTFDGNSARSSASVM